MKFKVTSKDLVIFSVFCLFLLYFSAIAVLNVLTLINEGTFYGLNPFEAFTGKYIFGTLLLFISVLVAAFFSVSSSIFSRSKGIGFSIGEKDSKGYSRWLTTNEMKKAFKIFKVGVKDADAQAAGIVMINDGKNLWVDDSENHTLVIGTTGSGKTTAVVDPLIYSLAKHRESMVFTDPKGEIYANHAEYLRARGYNCIVLNFRDPQLGNAWNPLTLPYRLYHEGNVDKAVELIDDVASNIVKDAKAQDPFWTNSASDYFAGCAIGLLEDAKEEQVNLNSISLMTTVGEEKFGAGSTYIKEYFTMKGEQTPAYTFASNTINSPTETKGGILSTFRQKIRIFSSRENLSEMLAYSDFNMRDIGKEPTAVFMIIHDEKTTYHALATIFIKQCYETLISVAQSCGGKLPVRTNFILDEFANMPALKDVTTMVTAARSRQIRFTFIIQNFAQLNDVYGKEDAETIRSNCGNLIYILTTELAALEEISKLCGEVKNEKDEKTESHPLITVSDLQKMKMNEVIILRHRYHPFKTQLEQAFNVDWGDREFGKASLIEREKKEIEYFDVKEFVKLRKRSKMGIDDKSSAPGMSGMPGGMPSGGGMPDLASIMGGGLSGEQPRPPKIPTFEEFMAARNSQRNAGIEPKATAKKSNVPTFNVDDLVKRIDAKIAELEAQEKAEEEKSKAATTTVPEKPSIPEPVIETVKQKPSMVIEDSTNDINPNSEKVIEPNYVNKDVIQGIDSIETAPINAPKITPPTEEKTVTEQSNQINTFSDLMNNGSIQVSNVGAMPSAPVQSAPVVETPQTPSVASTPVNSTPVQEATVTQQTPVMPSAQASSTPSVPVAPVTPEAQPTVANAPVQSAPVAQVVSPVNPVPVENKPLTGIVDPTKLPIQNVAPVVPTSAINPVQSVQTIEASGIPVNPVQQPVTNSVVQSKNDEEFFDDFFDND